MASISAFFPCYNDATTIGALVRTASSTLEELVDDFEIIVVDDGSTDDSLAVLRRLVAEVPRLRILAHRSNLGYGAALRSGFAAARMDWIFYTDGDGQYDPSELRRLVRLVTPGVGVAQGWKLSRGDGITRSFVGRAYHASVARLFGLGVRDTDCDFRLMRRTLVDAAHLECDSGAICVELMFRLEHSSERVVETAVHHFFRPHGRSQFFRPHHLIRTFAELVRLWFRLTIAPHAHHLPTRDLDTTAPSDWSRRRRMLLIAALVAISFGAHLWGFQRDLPMPDVDEHYFVTPAAYIAASGDLNPHWFGHPGSTVIYPLAVVFRAREVLFHGAPLVGAAPSVAARFASDPGSFYLAGRLWAMAFSLAAVVLVFAIGRRVFGDLVALLATALWMVVPVAVQYGRITRTDSVALFFALLTILACVRALERPSPGRFVLAGAAAGLGVSSRFFLAALAVLLVVTWLAVRTCQPEHGPHRDSGTGAVHVPTSTVAFGLAAMAGVFALTTPYLFLDPHDAFVSLSAEATTRIPFQSHGYFDNLAFYVVDAIPHAVSWLGLAVAVLGVVHALLRGHEAPMVLAVWVGCIVVGVSVFAVHWDRWIIPALPVVALFAAYGVVTIARTVTSRLRNAQRRGTYVGLVGALMLGIVIGPATSLVALDRAAAEPSTRVVAQRWIGKHIPRGSGVAVEIRGPDLTGTHYRYVQHYTLPSSGTVADYAQAGFRYLVINEGIASKFAAHPHRSGKKAAFYDYLVGDAHLLANFRRDRVHPGPHLEVYDLGRSIRLRDVDSAREPSELTTLMISHDNDAAEKPGPDPVAQRGLLQLAATVAVPRVAHASRERRLAVTP